MSSFALHASLCEYISRFKLGTVIIMELEIIVVVRVGRVFVTFKYCTDMDKESLLLPSNNTFTLRSDSI